VNWPGTLYTSQERRELLRCGALLEFCAAHFPREEEGRQTQLEWIRQAGAGRCVVSTDYGQTHNPLPTQGFEDFLTTLYQEGLTEKEIGMMARENPAFLVS